MKPIFDSTRSYPASTYDSIILDQNRADLQHAKKIREICQGLAHPDTEG